MIETNKLITSDASYYNARDWFCNEFDIKHLQFNQREILFKKWLKEQNGKVDTSLRKEKSAYILDIVGTAPGVDTIVFKNSECALMFFLKWS